MNPFVSVSRDSSRETYALTSREFRVRPDSADAAWTRPPAAAVSEQEYNRQRNAIEYRAARAKHVRTCAPARRLVSDSHGRFRCKRSAPFEVSEFDDADDNGQRRSKRSYGFLNSWIEDISTHARCNIYGKLIPNGHDTRDISFYVTTYPTKKQGRSFDFLV